MKKRSCFIITAFFLLLLLPINVFANDVTDKLYFDITIQENGDILVKEVASLAGTYNGRSREIEFSSYNSTPFTGIYSNFLGNTDIYSGTSLVPVKVGDIDKNNIMDFNNWVLNKEYKLVDDADNGDYGVYMIDLSSIGSEYKIFCSSDKDKAFYMEYIIKDAVVVHNDIAELYWNLIGENYREGITELKAYIHLPGEDNDVRIWTHGPFSGRNEIIDKKTLYFYDTNVSSYNAETIRIMFNKELVSLASKKSGVDGLDSILNIEAMLSDSENAKVNIKKLEAINTASREVEYLKEYKTIEHYNASLNAVNDIDPYYESYKNDFLHIIDSLKEEVNINWQKEIDNSIYAIREYKGVTRDYYKLVELIDSGFDQELKNKYNNELPSLLELTLKNEKDIMINRALCFSPPLIILIVIMITRFLYLKSEKEKFPNQYYREFPSEDTPYALEYLMTKKVSSNGISAIILDLIRKKVISISGDKKDYVLTLDNLTYVGNKGEKAIINVLFNIVGKDNKCNLKKLRENFSYDKAKKITDKIQSIKDDAKEEIDRKNIFVKNNAIVPVLEIILLFGSIVIYFGMLAFIFEYANYLFIIAMYFLVTIIYIIYFIILSKTHKKTIEGQELYAKWLAHKRFLLDFGRLSEKDIPEVALWDKYLVTATVFGIADKVSKKMQILIPDYDTDMLTNIYLMNVIMDSNITRSLNTSVSQGISTSTSVSYSSSSNGMGGGSSFGGGFGGGGGGGGRF